MVNLWGQVGYGDGSPHGLKKVNKKSLMIMTSVYILKLNYTNIKISKPNEVINAKTQ